MSSEKNKRIVSKLFEGINQGNLAVVDQLLAPDFVWHGNNDQTKSDYRKDLESILTAFPDAQWQIDDLLVDGDKVVVRWTFFGTHKKAWQSVTASGRRVTYAGISIFRLVDGKIAEVWNNENLLSFYRQLGFIINPPKKRTWW